VEVLLSAAAGVVGGASVVAGGAEVDDAGTAVVAVTVVDELDTVDVDVVSKVTNVPPSLASEQDASATSRVAERTGMIGRMWPPRCR